MITQTYTPTRPVIPVFLAAIDVEKETRLAELRSHHASAAEIRAFLTAYSLPRLECRGIVADQECPLRAHCECGHMGANAHAYGDRNAPDLYATGHCPAEGVLDRLYATDREAA